MSGVVQLRLVGQILPRVKASHNNRLSASCRPRTDSHIPFARFAPPLLRASPLNLCSPAFVRHGFLSFFLSPRFTAFRFASLSSAAVLASPFFFSFFLGVSFFFLFIFSDRKVLPKISHSQAGSSSLHRRFQSAHLSSLAAHVVFFFTMTTLKSGFSLRNEVAYISFFLFILTILFGFWN